MQGRKLLHGGDYNPEQWLDRPDILAQDIELMKKAHYIFTHLLAKIYHYIETTTSLFSYLLFSVEYDSYC